MQRPDLDNDLSKEKREVTELFSDLNCPFCFAMHERIDSLGLNKEVSWCLVEHAPSSNSELKTDEQAALLQFEFNLIRQRASEVEVKRPDFCVNTRLAILSFISLELEDADKARLYIQVLFKAYWQLGLNISDPQVLHKLLVSVGASGLQVSDAAREKQKHWQQRWELGEFDRRIPVLVSGDGQRMYGLQHPENINSFLLNVKQEILLQGETCLHHGDFTVAVLGLESLVEDYERHPNGIKLKNFNDVKELIREHSINIFDGIIISFNLDKKSNFLLIRKLKHHLEAGVELPIIYLSDESNGEDEIQAFNLGANDFAQIKLGLDALSARLKNCLLQARVVRLLHRHAAIDGLTGVLNKREFEQSFEREWRNACRNKLNLSLIMIDIDYFKLYNDSYGHCAGDDVLRKVASCLGKDLYRAKDVLARFGGEEFVILLPDTKQHGLEFICQQLRSSIESLALPHSESKVSDGITVSIGGCFSTPHPDQTPKQMIELADGALYQAKDRGRNQYVIVDMECVSYQ